MVWTTHPKAITSNDKDKAVNTLRWWPCQVIDGALTNNIHCLTHNVEYKLSSGNIAQRIGVDAGEVGE